jgi:catechol-2,3-dioxygenase
MKARRIDHVGIVVHELDAAKEFFLEIQTYEDTYKLLYVRGPEGIILELAQQIKH